MQKISLLIAAAGKGSRSGLAYPKTLFEIEGKTILERIISTCSAFIDCISIVASPSGAPMIESHLNFGSIDAEILIQNRAIGMADAVFQFRNSAFYGLVDHVVIVWGDVPFLESTTVADLISIHLKNENHVSIASVVTESPYTFVERDHEGRFIGLMESREHPGIANRESGERDIGLFVVKIDCLEVGIELLPYSVAPFTGEYSFLQLLGKLQQRGLKVEAYPIASKRESLSFNQPSDLEQLR